MLSDAHMKPTALRTQEQLYTTVWKLHVLSSIGKTKVSNQAERYVLKLIQS